MRPESGNAATRGNRVSAPTLPQAPRLHRGTIIMTKQVLSSMLCGCALALTACERNFVTPEDKSNENTPSGTNEPGSFSTGPGGPASAVEGAATAGAANRQGTSAAPGGGGMAGHSAGGAQAR